MIIQITQIACPGCGSPVKIAKIGDQVATSQKCGSALAIQWQASASITDAETQLPPEASAVLKEFLRGFSESEMHTIAFDMGIDWESMGGRGSGRNDLARNFVAHVYQKNRQEELKQIMRAQNRSVRV